MRGEELHEAFAESKRPTRGNVEESHLHKVGKVKTNIQMLDICFLEQENGDAVIPESLTG